MYLLDTDVVTNPLKPRPSQSLLARLAMLIPEQQHITTITVAEIAYGAYRSGRPEYHLERLRRLVLSQVRVLPFDEAAAYHYGMLRAQLEAAGTPLANLDLQIAAIALVHGLVLVTGNTRHFERIPGLRVENWMRT